ncbi:MAG TPA: ribosome maturation factor RimP [Acetobacteraceae bacterium]
MDQLHPPPTGLEARIVALVEPSLADMGFELVRVAVLGRDRPTVQIMIDRTDGEAVSLEDCEHLGRHFNAVMTVEDPMPGPWTLEISSPGIDRPLTRVKDWNRYAGHLARVELNVPLDGRKRFAGIVLGADNETARLRMDDSGVVALKLNDLRTARLVLTDALIDATTTPTKPN